MALARSKITTQGHVSVPAEVCRRLGVGPGSVLEWDEQGETIVIRRSPCYTSDDVHRALFPDQAIRRRTLNEMKQAIRRHARERHARR